MTGIAPEGVANGRLRLGAQVARPGVHLAIIAASVVACYANGLHGAFLFDDQESIVENPALGEWAAGPTDPPLRRVAYLTFKLSHRLGGLDPFGYHLLNVAVHVLAAFAVYALGRRLLAVAAGEERDRPAVAWAALGGALVFAVHPIQTQAVTYVVQRITSLAALLYLTALVLYLDARDGGRVRPARAAAYAGALAAAALGMWTKEIVFTLPIAILLVELVFLRGGLRERALAVAPFVALLPVIPWVVLRAPGGVAAVRAMGAYRETLPRLDYLATQAKVVVEYLRLLVLPIGQTLDHDVPAEHGFASPRVVLCALLLAALLAAGLALAARARGGARVAGFGILLFFLALSVESTIVPIEDVMNEHRLYLPSAGVALAVAGLLHAAWSRRRALAPWLAAAVAVVAVALGAATVARNAVWGDGVALWRDVTEKSPQLPRGHYNLGNALRDAGDLDGAAASWRRAVELDPANALAWNQLGNVALLRGDLAAAEADYRRALSGGRALTDALYNLGLVLEQTGRRGEALVEYRRFLENAGPARRAEAEALRARLGL